MLSISKEAFNLLSTAKIAAVGMDTKKIPTQPNPKWRLPSGEVVIKLVLEQEHTSSLYLSIMV